ncbi:MAG: hypothetical protein KAS04_05155 [Candidatus Aenigmarchaeota archaeon]|nr:hypothetical protein [Candidatus Aenigmarchaeota archaeon]
MWKRNKKKTHVEFKDGDSSTYAFRNWEGVELDVDHKKKCEDCGKNNFFKYKGRIICIECGSVVLTEEDKKPEKFSKEDLEYFEFKKNQKKKQKAKGQQS